MPKRKMNQGFVFAIVTVMGVICGAGPAFGGLTLADLYSRAIANAERIKLVQEQVKISQTGKDKAHAAAPKAVPSIAGGE